MIYETDEEAKKEEFVQLFKFKRNRIKQ